LLTIGIGILSSEFSMYLAQELSENNGTSFEVSFFLFSYHLFLRIFFRNNQVHDQQYFQIILRRNWTIFIFKILVHLLKLKFRICYNCVSSSGNGPGANVCEFLQIRWHSENFQCVRRSLSFWACCQDPILIIISEVPKK